MGEFSPWHLAIVALVFVVLFGARKLPDAARGIGQSLRIFKAEMKAGIDGEPTPAETPAQPASTAQVAEPLPAAQPTVATNPVTSPVQQPTTS
ncbi:Sec-independent protein translocase subunit TatA [Kutzneria sp. NPDC052558]|uniref:Sec-independent protein translocase subunit TatA n=1 Tax=Kutzneria sp. NPDC052558 TaxID=3364121 RepID=UPI0037CA814A